MNPGIAGNINSAVREAIEVDALDEDLLVVFILYLNSSNVSKPCWDGESSLIHHLSSLWLTLYAYPFVSFSNLVSTKPNSKTCSE
ncbi:hypothetical protein FF1_039595 [Malus domestica]